jgi:hypothetical protein
LIFLERYLPALARILAIFAASLCSPAMPLLKWLLHPYLDLDLILSKGLTFQNMLETMINLQALGGPVLLLQITPILLAGCLLSIAFLLLCARLGDALSRWMISRLVRQATIS